MKRHRAVSKAARLALAVVLVAFLGMPIGGNALLDATCGTGFAWAEETGASSGTSETGTITIKAAEGNEQTSYDAYKIFDASIASDSVHTATDISWSSTAMATAVNAALTQWGAVNSAEYSKASAQDAADYINAHLGDEEEGVKAASLEQTLAKKLTASDSGVSATKSSISANTKTSLPEGYWLFVTSSASSASGTSPVFYTVVGGVDVTVSEKTSLPTVQKTVGDGSTSGKAGDAFIGADLQYTITGTVAENIDAYDSYSYVFTDTLDAGLDLAGTTGGSDDGSKAFMEESGWSVKAYNSSSSKLGVDIDTNDYEASYTDRVLKVKFNNLKSITPLSTSKSITVSKDMLIVVTYRAHLNTSAATGVAHENKVVLTYSNSPFTTGTGHTESETASVYTYALKLLKVDRTTEDKLAGAKFTLNYKDEQDQSACYLVASQADGIYTVTGTTANEVSSGRATHATEFESNSDGLILVQGLKAGTYEVVETQAPNGYNTVESFEVTLEPQYEGTTLAKLTNSLESSTSVIAGSPDHETGDLALTGNKEDAVDKSTGTVLVTVGDTKQVRLPFTGLSGVAFTWVAGAAMLLLTLAYALRSSCRKRGAHSL